MSNTWKWDRFYGGIASDNYIGPEATFPYGQYVDVKTNSRAIRPSAKPLITNFTETTNESVAVVDIFNKGDENNSLFIANNTTTKKGYGFILSGGTMTKVIDMTSATETVSGVKECLGAGKARISGNDYVLIFGRTKIHLYNIATQTTTYNSYSWGSDYDTTFASASTLTLNGLSPMSVVSNTSLGKSNVYFHDIHNVWYLNTIAPAPTKIFQLPYDETIVSMTFMNDFLRVYARNISGTKLYLLPLATLDTGDYATAPTYQSYIEGFTIKGAVSDGNIDYLSGGDTLAQSSGTQIQIVYRSGHQTSTTGSYSSSLKCNLGAFLSIKNGVIYISGGNGTYTYGAYYPGFPNGINKAFSINGAISAGLSLLGNTGSGTSICQLLPAGLNISEFEASGATAGDITSMTCYALSPVFDGTESGFSTSFLKRIKEINLGFEKKTPNSGFIDIYVWYRTKDFDSSRDDTWSILCNTSGLSLTARTAKFFPQQFTSMPNEFAQIQFRIAFVQGGALPQLGTGSFYSLDMVYDVIKNI